MSCRVDGSIRRWELENKASFDTAGIGSSALLAALFRNLIADACSWLNIQIAAIFSSGGHQKAHNPYPNPLVVIAKFQIPKNNNGQRDYSACTF